MEESYAFDYPERRASGARRASDTGALDGFQGLPLSTLNINSHTFGREHRLARRLRERVLAELVDDHEALDVGALDDSLRAFLARNALQRLDDEGPAWKKLLGEVLKLEFVLDDLDRQALVAELATHAWSSSAVLFKHVLAGVGRDDAPAPPAADGSALAQRCRAHFKRCSRAGLGGRALLDAVIDACRAELGGPCDAAL